MVVALPVQTEDVDVCIGDFADLVFYLSIGRIYLIEQKSGFGGSQRPSVSLFQVFVGTVSICDI